MTVLLKDEHGIFTCFLFLDIDVNFEEIARTTEDFNGAMLKAVCVEAGMLALRRNATSIGHEDFMDGIIQVSVLSGDIQRKSFIIVSPSCLACRFNPRRRHHSSTMHKYTFSIFHIYKNGRFRKQYVLLLKVT